MYEFTWGEILEAVAKYVRYDLTAFDSVCSCLESGRNSIDDFPGLRKLLIENQKNK